MPSPHLPLAMNIPGLAIRFCPYFRFYGALFFPRFCTTVPLSAKEPIFIIKCFWLKRLLIFGLINVKNPLHLTLHAL